MKLTPWKGKNIDPFRDFFDLDQSLFSRLRNLDRAFDEAWLPAIDISEDKNNYIVKADIPGLKKDDIHVSFENGLLTIRGERKYENEEKDKNYHRVERSYGSFQRSLSLGADVDPTKVKAKYNNGVLELTIAKSEKAKSQDIVIE